MLSFIFTPPPDQKALYRPKIDFIEINDDPIQMGPFSVTSCVIPHGPEFSTAFKVHYEGRAFVYAPDCSGITPELMAFMTDCAVVMIDGLRDRPHPSHLTVDDSVNAIEASGAARGFLSHLGHDILHAELERRLPTHIRPAYDGLEFTW